MLQIDYSSVYVFYFSHRCRGRADHMQRFSRVKLVHKQPEIMHGCLQHSLILRRSKHCHHMGRGRIIHKDPVSHLLLIELLVVLPGRCLDAVMIRAVSLDQGMPLFFASSGTSYCLSQKLEGALPAAVIVCIQGKIRRDHAD